MRKYRVTYAALLVSTLVAGQLAGSIAAPAAAAAATSKTRRHPPLHQHSNSIPFRWEPG